VRSTLSQILLLSSFVLPPILSAQEAKPQERQREPCTVEELEGTEWLDWIHRKVFRSVCSSALWFDSFFGDERVEEQRQVSHGWIRGGILLDTQEGPRPDVRADLKLALPRLEGRATAYLGRDTESNLISDASDGVEGIPSHFVEAEARWVAGLGYTPMRSRFSRFRLDAGVTMKWPPNPFLKARYTADLFSDRLSLVRYRQTLFWTGRDGLGTTGRLDLERALSPRLMIRQFNIGTLRKSTEGLDWQSGLVLYQYLGPGRAIAYLGEVFGETGRDPGLEDFGFRIMYRQNVAREWFFIQAEPALSWPREDLSESRVAVPGILLAVELNF
jgi:hypothetical protein